jgi:hypothetical protein
METRYNLGNIRDLLIEGFTDQELRWLCYDEPDFRPVHDELSPNIGTGEIVSRLIEYAERRLLMERLLALAKELNPARYDRHQPYYHAPEKPSISGDSRVPRRAMRYYLYISDVKVNMLWAQVTARLRRRLAHELGIKLETVAKGPLDGPAGTMRYERLDVVVAYINRYERVGTVDEPARFFRGNMRMRWTPDLSHEVLELAGFPNMVYFGGTTGDTVLGLGGSQGHVIGGAGGSPQSSDAYLSSTTLTYFLRTMFHEGEIPEDTSVPEQRDRSLEAIVDITGALGGPWQTMEFLALRVAEGRVKGGHVLLGTPLYVALSND